MSNPLTQRDELLNAVKAPERKKKEPSNWALYAAIVFANAVFCLLDIISGVTVWWMTGFSLYGILAFLAGFGPLLLHEFLFVRPYASELQKKIAVTGAVIALFSIVGVGVAAGVINMMGVESVGVQTAEIATVITLVLIASIHAIMAVIYFYIDDGIRAQQQTAQAMARAKFQGEQIKAGDFILTLTQQSVNRRKEIESRHGSPAALMEVLRQLGIDEDGDGIPDVLQQSRQQLPRQQLQAYNQDASRQQFSPNGHERQEKQTEFTDPTNPRQQ